MKTLLIGIGGWRYVIVTLLMVSITISGIVLTLSSLRKEAIATQMSIATLHGRTFEEHFAQTLQTIEHTIDRIPFLSNHHTTQEGLSPILVELLHNAPYLRSLSLVNEKGFIQASSNPANISHQVDIKSFIPLPFNDTALLRMGVPWMGRDFDMATPSTPQNPITPRSINFVPVLKKIVLAKTPYYLVASLNTDYLANRYANALPIEHGILSIWRLDGILLFSTDNTIRAGISHFHSTHQPTHESFFEHLKETYHTLIGSVRLARTLPFIIDVEINENVALGYWEQERNKVLWVSTLLISLSGLLGLVLLLRNYKEVERQKEQIAYEKRFRLAMEATQTGLWTYNIETNVITWDKQCFLLLGYPPDAFVPSLEMIDNLTHPDDAEKSFGTIVEQVITQSSFIIERRMKHYNGTWMWIQARGKVIEFTHEGMPLLLTGVYINIDAQKQAEQLRLSAVAFDTQDAIVITDAKTKIVKVNQAFTKITGYAPEDVIGKTPTILQSGVHDKEFYANMWKTLNKEGFWQGEIWNKRKNGELYAEDITITAIRDQEGEITHFLANFSDITVHKVAQKQIEELAFRDPLTRLANRHLLHENLSHTLKQNNPKKILGALLFIDLDHFKELNDTYGHDAGDMLLVQVAQKLRDCTRENDTVARLGGDEFVILIENIGNDMHKVHDQVKSVALKILTRLNKPFPLAHGNYSIQASIGITIFGSDKIDADEIIKEADIAMYHAKENGRNQICFFDEKGWPLSNSG